MHRYWQASGENWVLMRSMGLMRSWGVMRFWVLMRLLGIGAVLGMDEIARKVTMLCSLEK
jgi:hypothetical protein